jgi:GGDEF domain-containing protein
MSAPDSASQTILDALGVTEVADAAIDPIGLGSSLAKALAGAARRPVRSIPVGMRLVRDVAGASVSVGVAVADEPGRPIPEVIERADKAMYDAKRAGRDRVIAG